MSAILFGSISTIADTSELQRKAFNDAFARHGLDWSWDQDTYRSLLTSNGGAQRIADYAAERGETVDAAAVHKTKSELFQQSLASSGITPRPGVADTVKSAKDAGYKIALVTTTTPENVEALTAATKDALSWQDFDLVVDLSKVPTSKPDAAAYSYALEHLGESADDAVAIEDNVGGVQSAANAGVPVVAFPNANTAGHDFAAASKTVANVDFSELSELIGAAK